MKCFAGLRSLSRLSFSSLLLLPVVVLVCSAGTMAQSSKCTEPSIREAVQKVAFDYTDDSFFWSGAFDRPLIGKAVEDASEKVAASRKDEVSTEKPDRVVVSSGGDMAYEYGTGSLSFVERDSGKRISFQVGYLRVWRVANGRCKVAATLYKPIESTIQTK